MTAIQKMEKEKINIPSKRSLMALGMEVLGKTLFQHASLAAILLLPPPLVPIYHNIYMSICFRS